MHVNLFFNDGELRHDLLHAAVPRALVFAKSGIVEVHLLQCQIILSALLTDLHTGTKIKTQLQRHLLIEINLEKNHLIHAAKGAAAQMIQNSITINNSQRRSILIHRLNVFLENIQLFLLNMIIYKE